MSAELFLFTRGYSDRTLGTLFVKDNGVQLFRCASLELPWKDNATGTSCVPVGRYEIRLEPSPAFKMDLWELYGVPGRSEVKVHAANFPRQLRGCIAPAMYFADIDKDGNMDATASRKALEGVMNAMKGLTRSWITIAALDDQRVLRKGMNGMK